MQLALFRLCFKNREFYISLIFISFPVCHYFFLQCLLRSLILQVHPKAVGYKNWEHLRSHLKFLGTGRRVRISRL